MEKAKEIKTDYNIAIRKFKHESPMLSEKEILIGIEGRKTRMARIIKKYYQLFS